jgi:hypothetical protein
VVNSPEMHSLNHSYYKSYATKFNKYKELVTAMENNWRNVIVQSTPPTIVNHPANSLSTETLIVDSLVKSL